MPHRPPLLRAPYDSRHLYPMPRKSLPGAQFQVSGFLWANPAAGSSPLGLCFPEKASGCQITRACQLPFGCAWRKAPWRGGLKSTNPCLSGSLSVSVCTATAQRGELLQEVALLSSRTSGQDPVHLSWPHPEAAGMALGGAGRQQGREKVLVAP